MGRFIDLSGKKFGRLTVLKRVPNLTNSNTKWLCQCECGNTIEVQGGHLKDGHTQSCGCFNKEQTIKSNKNRRFCNEYVTFDDNTVFVKFSNCNEYFLCDLDDWDGLKQYTWYKNNDGYAMARVDGKISPMHRMIMNTPEELVTDHMWQVRNGVCDNRKTNLRVCTQLENTRNTVNYSNNTSGRKGVCWDNTNRKWVASINVNKKRITLGYFDNKDDAIIAREQAEVEYFGEFRGCS